MFELRMNSSQGLNQHPRFGLGYVLSLGLLSLILGGALGFRAATVGKTVAARNPVATPASAVRPVNGFAEVARQVEGAVVNIHTDQLIHATVAPLGSTFGKFFKSDTPVGSFFQRVPQDLKRRNLGSGFVVEPDGYILTNNDVVENASRIKVKLSDGRITDATLVGSDPQTDLAVLKIKLSNLPALRLAKSDQVQVGDWVLAIGSPFDLAQTMTAGIISAKGRVIGAGPYDYFLQTDAAINPGNSGGPLVNLRGEVVGISTVIAGQNGGFQGVGFAVPSSTAEDVYRQITKSGRVSRGWLGIHGQEVTREIAQSFNLGDQRGVLVADVDAGGPAAKGGLESGDIILEFNDQEVHNMHELSVLVAGTKIGSPSRVKLLRKDETLALNLNVGERPADISESYRSFAASEHGVLGITVESITPEIQGQLNLASLRGALITDVKPGSPADEAGVRPGDVVHEVNHVPVDRASDLIAVIRNFDGGSVVLLKVERQGQTLFLAFELS